VFKSKPILGEKAVEKSQIRRIGLMSPGDMGQAVGIRLKELGFEVCTALAGRSERTRRLAAEGKIADCGDLRTLLESTDLVLSILDPGAAMGLAQAAAAILPSVKSPPLYTDCNALAPLTKAAMQSLLEAAGARFLDAGIIGPPPRGAGRIRFYASGPGAADLGVLQHEAITVRVVSERVGDAAAVKMCYGGVTKGAVALLTELLVAARRLGVEEVLDEELRGSQAALRDWILKNLPSMPPKAYRWVPETEEIAATFGAVGLTPLMMQGAAETYAAIATTAVGKESPEEARTAARNGAGVIGELDATLPGAQ
jgi:3-hydroxyisobutyrate dehydrogenase-like beta-hydroxyacid dehydrogenase